MWQLLPAGAPTNMAWHFHLRFTFLVNIKYTYLLPHIRFSVKRAAVISVSWVDCEWHRPLLIYPGTAIPRVFLQAGSRKYFKPFSILFFWPHNKGTSAIVLKDFGKCLMNACSELQSFNRKGHTCLAIKAQKPPTPLKENTQCWQHFHTFWI